MQRKDPIMKGELCTYPLVYGNLSYPIPTKRNQKYSNWIVYLRGQHFQDISFLVKKVVFHLHQSFQKKVREITSPPFEVKEAGWGAFEILIQVVLKSGQLIEFKHNLKLHHLHSPNQSKKPLISEYLDQLVFLNPTKQQKGMLARCQKSVRPTIEQDCSGQDESMSSQYKSYIQFAHQMNRWQLKQEEQRLKDSIKFISHEINQYKDRLEQLDHEIQKGYDDISQIK